MTKRHSSDGESNVSIYEVADRAGVSIVTVSRVFNNYPHVSNRMRDRVFAAAREVGYKPRVVVKRQVIAVIIGHLDHLAAGDYKTRLAMRVMIEAAKVGYLVDFIPYDAVELATKHHVDGIIEIGLTDKEAASLNDLPNVPTVFINKTLTRGADHCFCVCSDHYLEVRTATEYLLDNGHTRIALVLDELTGWGPEHKQTGFSATLATRVGPTEGTPILSTDTATPLEIASRIKEAGCTAALLFTDNAGMPLLDALANELHLNIPEDLSVVGLENMAISPYLSPRLSTIKQPLEELAAAAVRCITGDQPPSTTSFFFPSRLIKRASVKNISGR
ncbi:MAG: LacI family transcriptional regulator [Spartobacteria bacterium]|nr:LacI family transcriptional regulator [Spartobacteria bacterium]